LNAGEWRPWLTESDIQIAAEATRPLLALNEPSAHQTYTDPMDTLERLHLSVLLVLREFAQSYD